MNLKALILCVIKETYVLKGLLFTMVIMCHRPLHSVRYVGKTKVPYIVFRFGKKLKGYFIIFEVQAFWKSQAYSNSKISSFLLSSKSVND